MRTASHSTPELAQSADGAQFVVCGLAGQEYAIPADNVREVFRFAAVLPLPDSPPWVLGVIDVRGRVVPVVDGRRRLGLPEREDWLRAVIVLIEYQREHESGFVVDEALDMVRITAAAIEPAGDAAGPFAVGRAGERMLLIVDPSIADPRADG
jgi:purine-binding chemotaxis protein CheW